MKKLVIIISLTFALPTFAQLKVDQYGRIGMGTNYPNPEFKCHIAGNLLLTSYPSNPYYEIRMKVNNGWPGTEIGSNAGNIAFWSTNFNNLYAANYYTTSDITLKSNITTIELGLAKIMKIRPVFYSIKEHDLDSSGSVVERKIQQYGFISQEIEKTLPEVKITQDAKGLKLMDYDQIIPITVAAIQEQQKMIDSLKNELNELKIQIKNTLDLRNNLTFNSEEKPQSTLSQNVPNPFNQNTEIKFLINDQNFRKASIVIFDMNGVLIKQYEIQKSGNSSIEINANELKAGMYIYTLIVNEREIDSKRMILLN